MKNMETYEIYKVCDDCGRAANYLTCWKKYGQPPKKAKFDLSTFHKGSCDFCGREANVTEPRDYFYPDFELLKRLIGKINKSEQ